MFDRGGKHDHQMFFINVVYEYVVTSFQSILIITIASENISYKIRLLYFSFLHSKNSPHLIWFLRFSKMNLQSSWVLLHCCYLFEHFFISVRKCKLWIRISDAYDGLNMGNNFESIKINETMGKQNCQWHTFHYLVIFIWRYVSLVKVIFQSRCSYLTCFESVSSFFITH